MRDWGDGGEEGLYVLCDWMGDKVCEMIGGVL